LESIVLYVQGVSSPLTLYKPVPVPWMYMLNFSQHVLLGTLVLGLSLKIVMIICYQGTTNVLENVKVVKKRYINSNKTCITTQAHYNNKEFTYQVYVTVMIYDYNNHTLLSNDETYICNLTYYQDYG
jgi:hypothetical protein